MADLIEQGQGISAQAPPGDRGGACGCGKAQEEGQGSCQEAGWDLSPYAEIVAKNRVALDILAKA